MNKVLIKNKILINIMSNYLEVNYGKPYENTNFKVKNKYIEKEDPSKDVPGFWLIPKTKCDVVDEESSLITPAINSKDKSQIKLNDTMHPEDYNINYSNNLKYKENEKFYYTNKDGGAGRGFGNLNISNDIRFGDFTRKDTKEFKEKQEGQMLFDYQFQYLDKDFQDPKHLVMPIPRGGDTTRKQNQLSVNTMRHYNNIKKNKEITKTIRFDY